MACLLSKSVFIHTPKTAGQWIAAALDNAGLVVRTSKTVHASPAELASEPAFSDQKFLFTFVRHPASWYQSMWAHQMDEKWDAIEAPDWFSPRWIGFWAGFTKNCRSDSFEVFVRKCIEYYPQGLVSDLFDRYTERCSFVGKQENLEEDLCKALDLSGERYDQKKLINTRPKNVRGQRVHRKRASQYSSELLELVLQNEKHAIERYGYHEIT